MQEKISVIMSTYNEEKSWLQESIESIINQTYRNIEFIIVLDNPSNKMIEQVVNDYKSKDDRINVIRNSKNMGLVYSLNKAIEEATGKYIARMDADDISLPERLEKQLLYIKKYNLDLIGTNIENITQDKVSMGQSKNPSSCKIVRKLLKYGDCVAHPTWLAVSNVFRENEGYRDIQACEDYDFLLRIASRGYKIANLPEVCLLYRYNFNGISRTNKARQKFISCFLRRNRKKLCEISAKELNDYVGSIQSTVEIGRLEKYFIDSQAILEYKISHQKNKFLLAGIKLVLFSKYGRRTLLEKFIQMYFYTLDQLDSLK